MGESSERPPDPLLVRLRRTTSPFDGAPLWALPHLTDEDLRARIAILEKHVSDLAPAEFERLVALWREQRDRPLAPAVQTIRHLEAEHRKRVERLRRPYGATEARRHRVKRVHAVVRGALWETRGMPHAQRAANVAERTTDALMQPDDIRDGPLAGLVHRPPAEPHDADFDVRVKEAVEAGLEMASRGTSRNTVERRPTSRYLSTRRGCQAAANCIVLAALLAVYKIKITEDYLLRMLRPGRPRRRRVSPT